MMSNDKKYEECRSDKKGKILFCASTSGHILHFHLPYLQAFQKLGYEVWAATNRCAEIPYADHVVSLPLEKSLLSPRNVRAIFAFKRLLKQQGFDLISTHTTLASAVVRAAVLLLPRRKRPQVFCTSHGYLLAEAEGWKKWRYLLPEKLCATVTDVTMVMNHEDYEIAQKHRLYGKKLYFINGMGLDLKAFRPVPFEQRIAGRKGLGCTANDFLFVYAAEFSPRKNQALLLRAFASVAGRHAEMKLLLAGDGALLGECKALAKDLGLESCVQFLGYVENMRELYPLCDVSVTCSRMEGLPFNVMESMACGLPVVASNIKGHRELVLPNQTGFLFSSEDQKELEQQLELAFQTRKKFDTYRINALQHIQQYRLENVLPEIMKIYKENGRSLSPAP